MGSEIAAGASSRESRDSRTGSGRGVELCLCAGSSLPLP